MNICPNCSEKLTAMASRCPKCGITTRPARSPVLVAVMIIICLMAAALAGMILL